MVLTVLDVVTQAGATILGILFVILVGKKNKWGFVAGLASQPFWYATTIIHHQWILIAVNIVYTYSYAVGFREWFFQNKSSTQTFSQADPNISL